MATYEDPSTENAKIVGGVNDGTQKGYRTERYRREKELGITLGLKAYDDGSLGVEERITKNGSLKDSEMETELAIQNGIPREIRGDRLGCTCYQAHLNAVGPPVVNGVIEVDYMCNSGWHNYVAFQVRQYVGEAENSLKIDVNGNMTESDGFKAGELGEM